jgi:hypothetical protein
MEVGAPRRTNFELFAGDAGSLERLPGTEDVNPVSARVVEATARVGVNTSLKRARGFAGEPGFFGECRHSTDSVRHCTQSNGYRPLIAVGQNRFQILRDPNLASPAGKLRTRRMASGPQPAQLDATVSEHGYESLFQCRMCTGWPELKF